MKLLLLIFVLCFITSQLSAITDEELKEKTTVPRWLSIPNSRIVLNPTGISHTGALVPHLSEGAIASMPLHAGYFYGEYPERVPDIWSWKPVSSGIKPNSRLSNQTKSILQVKWSCHGVSLLNNKNVLELKQTDAKYGFIESEALSLNIKSTPLVMLDIDGDNDTSWAFKIGREGEHDININTGCWEKGLFIFDIRKYIPDTNGKKIYFRIFTVGKPGGSITVKDISAGSVIPEAEAFENITQYWQPSQINTIAVSQTRGTSLKAATFFADENTVAQRIIVTQANSDLLLQGVWNKGSIQQYDDVIILNHPQYSIIVACSNKSDFNIYANLSEYVKGNVSQNNQGTFWTLKIDNIKKGDIISVCAVFVPKGRITAEYISHARSTVNTSQISKLLEERISSWNTMLSKVPVPASFNLQVLKWPDTNDNINSFTPEEQTERMYYKAWTFLYQDLLPEQPENGYMYCQFACGKPSLWSEGHPKARASAQWESIIAMQFAGYILPDKAWDALTGITTLADDEGSIGGEGLPSRHCQTAWILYSLTGNYQKLRELYPAMKKILIWKINDPRWIYRNLTASNEKDIEFVTHALTDIGYMKKICRVLNSEDIAFWEAEETKLYKNMVVWFWKERGQDAHRIYREEPMGAHNTWTLVALSLAADNIQEPEKQSLIKLYREQLNPNIPLLLAGFSKHPSRQLLMRGLYWCNMYDDARLISESTLRDITLAGEFAESYNNGNGIVAEGVIPSIFGAANIIDSCMWLNNIWLSEGLPMIIPVGIGGVSNFSIAGKELNIMCENNEVIISGAAADMLTLTGFEKAADGTYKKKISEYEKVNLN